ncbi:hypothetical protein TrVE_jg5178 [Triparma verrucosa]|uniref:Iodothyronine deiodinase n=3 Tax=Triparma TaxID=722752 RepID=A0A9W7L8K4_9STRA|nr:hypothetical protein TrVE_jg5178 [Triparma verrucosa]GMH89300.1 hypothetical protein TrST_g947 [Triparma strigata]GMI37910.1 hypothetical protein TrCOL_g5131 [Triparma columacea]|mmetsp:Transcript_23802/g.44742  ORF Transcript_23802/g.44742 Transcript_23802/m.44742 type:complete len:90 (-) Transcript_23802:112-381(-)
MEEDVESHKCEEDRMKAAVKFSETYRDFAESFDYNLIDTMGDEFNNIFHSWPLRYWCIGRDGKIDFKAMPNDAAYSIEVFEEWLEKRFG